MAPVFTWEKHCTFCRGNCRCCEQIAMGSYQVTQRLVWAIPFLLPFLRSPVTLKKTFRKTLLDLHSPHEWSIIRGFVWSGGVQPFRCESSLETLRACAQRRTNNFLSIWCHSIFSKPWDLFQAQESHEVWTNKFQWGDTESVFEEFSRILVECRPIELQWFNCPWHHMASMALASGNLISKLKLDAAWQRQFKIDQLDYDKGSLVWIVHGFFWGLSTKRHATDSLGHLFLRPGWKESARSSCEPQEIQAKRGEAQLRLWSKATEWHSMQGIQSVQSGSMHINPFNLHFLIIFSLPGVVYLSRIYMDSNLAAMCHQGYDLALQPLDGRHRGSCPQCLCCCSLRRGDRHKSFKAAGDVPGNHPGNHPENQQLPLIFHGKSPE